MDLFSDIIQGVQDDMTIGDESSLFPLALVKRMINRSYLKASALYRWPETEDAKKTNTVASQDYYDYPDSWRPDSVWKVTIDGVRYGEEPDGSPLSFEDYLLFKEDNPTSTDKKWANQWRRYFIHPTPTANGTLNINVWGHRVVDALSADGDVTIFSYSMPECNEAIVKETVALLKHKGEESKTGQFLSGEALGILTISWNKIRQEQMKYETVKPFFYVPDFYSGQSKLKEDVIGNFTT